MIEEKEALFQKDLIFIEAFADINEAFTAMARRFVERGLVKSSYLAAIKQREQEYPTGIDLAVIGPNLPNVAIPHTEREHCLATRVVLVKLKQGIGVHNMMNPAQMLNNIKYLFMILNGSDAEQTGILGQIMGMVTDLNIIRRLEEAQTREELYDIVKNL